MIGMRRAAAAAAALWACWAVAGPAQTLASDRVSRLAATLEREPLRRDPQTGYLRPLLAALHLPVDSQLLVFSKTGVQQAHTGPHSPRALYFDESVVVGYVPGAPAIEIIAHDAVEGLAFYTLDQSAASPLPVRRTSCLTCHESAGTRDVPGFIVRSHTVGEDGSVLQNVMTPPSHDVDHSTSHPERWGGWLVTSEGVAPPYAQRAHQGNITFSPEGNTSSQVFIEWMAAPPESHGYLSESSDIVSLLAFDHQMPAANLMTRLAFEWRRAAGSGAAGPAGVAAPAVRALVDELADYFLFVREASMPVPLTPRAGFARALEARVPHDAQGRSLGQLDLVTRLLRYPCSYMVYSEAFDDLPAPVKQAVYRRLIDTLSQPPGDRRFDHIAAGDRRAILEILRATRADFPAL